MEATASNSHQQRKMQAKLQKRQRIEQSGGIRPRPPPTTSTTSTDKEINANVNEQKNIANVPLSSPSSSPASTFNKDQRRDRATSSSSSKHRFGRVMEHVPCRNVPRFSTLSIAIPSSILYNCQTRELKTLLCGQIARAATIYHVDEIIIYNDGTTKNSSNNHFGQTHSFERHSNKRRRDDLRVENDVTPKGDDDAPSAEPTTATTTRPTASDPHIFMARILQYCECPQYLRKHFFPIHSDLQFTGLLAPIDAPHHVRADDRCKYREGVVLQQQPNTNTDGCLVNCGIRNRPVLIDQRLQPGIRCTVELDPAVYGRPGQIRGKVVSPSTITHTDGTYWGYTVRIASSMKAIFDECPYPLESGGYDLTIGTSERGSENIDDPNFSLQQRRINKSSGSYRHALIVFGGVAGIEESIDADESMPISGSLCQNLFDKWINICPYQGSRTIRSEEAVLITLAKLSPLLTKSAQSTSSIKGNPSTSSSDLLQEQKGYSSGKLPFEDDEKLSEESSDEDEN